MKILVVDDEAVLVKGISYNLRNDGYEVLTGSNGMDAVRTVRETPVDLARRSGLPVEVFLAMNPLLAGPGPLPGQRYRL